MTASWVQDVRHGNSQWNHLELCMSDMFKWSWKQLSRNRLSGPPVDNFWSRASDVMSLFLGQHREQHESKLLLGSREHVLFCFFLTRNQPEICAVSHAPNPSKCLKSLFSYCKINAFISRQLFNIQVQNGVQSILPELERIHTAESRKPIV